MCLDGTLRFASYYRDHMVLQKSPEKAVLWGYGPEGAQVTLLLSGPVKQRSSPVTVTKGECKPGGRLLLTSTGSLNGGRGHAEWIHTAADVAQRDPYCVCAGFVSTVWTKNQLLNHFFNRIQLMHYIFQDTCYRDTAEYVSLLLCPFYLYSPLSRICLKSIHTSFPGWVAAVKPSVVKSTQKLYLSISKDTILKYYCGRWNSPIWIML